MLSGVLGLTLSALAAVRQARHNENLARQRLAAMAQHVVERLQLRMRTYEYGLRGARGAVLSAGEQLTRDLFARYVRSRDLHHEFPGARGFGFIRRVLPANEQAFVAAARRELPGFTVHALGPPTNERWVIQYVEPIEPNLQARGLDIASERVRRAAALDAMRRAAPSLTAPITLAQAREPALDRHGFLLLLPVYTSADTPHTVEERTDSTVGWTYSPLVIDEVLNGVAVYRDAVTTSIADITTGTDAAPFYRNGGSEHQAKDGLATALTLPLYGRTWRIEVGARRAFLARLDLLGAPRVFLLGAVLSALVASLLFAILNSLRRSREALLQKTRLSTLVENSSDAIVTVSPDGRVVDWNRAAAQLFGYSAAEATGKSLQNLGLAVTGTRFSGPNFQGVPPYDTQVQSRAGSVRDVSVAITAVRSAQGDIVGLSHTIRDVTEQRLAQRKLGEFNVALEKEVAARTLELDSARHDLQTILDALPSMVGYWDKSLRNRFANGAYRHWFGLSPAQLVGLPMRDVLGDPLFELNRAYIEGALRGEPQMFERVMTNRSAEPRDTLVHYLPDAADGEVRGFYALVHDITDTKRATQALAQERERLDNILRGTNVGTWEWNVQTGETRFNERWAQIIGRSLTELEPTTIETWTTHAHPDDLVRSGELLQRHFSGEVDYYECECRMRHRAGHWVWVLDRGRVFSWTADGKPEWMFGTHQDITKIREVQERLAESEAFLERAGQIAGVGGFRVALDTLSVSWTRQTHRVFELDEQTKAVVPHELAFIGDESRSALRKAMAEAEQFGRGFDLELPLRTALGRAIWVRIVGAVELDNGRPARIVGTLQDVTDLHLAAEVLREATRAAQAANAAKSDFLANMSHEIRTPLNAVLGLANLLAMTRLDAQQRDLILKVQSAGRALLAVINDVLDISKIEAGEMLLEHAPFELNSLIADLLLLTRPQAQAKGLDLLVAFHDEATKPVVLEGDAARLRQVLTNLLSNAIKFTERGSVDLSLKVSAQAQGDCMCEFRVRDTGIGIPPEILARLFVPFSQADASTTRKFGGTGLGLSIVKKLTELMGGEVGAQSTPNVGSEFWVRIPFRPARKGTLSREAVFRVLVSHDQEAACRRLQDTCARLGWEGTQDVAGKLLDDLLSKAASGNPMYDLVVLGGGLTRTANEVASVLQTWPTALRPAFVIVSEFLREATDGSVVCRSAAPGATQLFNATNEAAITQQREFERVDRLVNMSAVNARWLSGVRLLVVDDSPLNLEVCQQLLEREGASVTLCANAHDALARLGAHPAAFDAVIMDVQMPELDGNQATRKIRDELRLARLPVIGLSAGALTAERSASIEAGMCDFVSKPFQPEALVRTIRRHVQRARGTPIAIVPRAQQTAETLERWPEVTGIDARRAARQLENNLTLFLSCLRAFERDFHDLAVHDDDATSNRAALSTRMHKLRGSAGLLGAHHIESVAAEIERTIRDGAEDAELTRSMATLRQALSALFGSAERLLASRAAPNRVQAPRD